MGEFWRDVVVYLIVRPCSGRKRKERGTLDRRRMISRINAMEKDRQTKNMRVSACAYVCVNLCVFVRVSVYVHVCARAYV